MCSTIFFLSPAPILPHPHNLNFTRLRIPSQPTPNQYHRHTISTSLNSVFPPIPHPPKIIFTLSQLHCSSYSLLSLTHPKSSSHYLNFTALHIPSYPPPTQDNLHSISTSLLFIFPPIPHPPKIIFTQSQLHRTLYFTISLCSSLHPTTLSVTSHLTESQDPVFPLNSPPRPLHTSLTLISPFFLEHLPFCKFFNLFSYSPYIFRSFISARSYTLFNE